MINQDHGDFDDGSRLALALGALRIIALGVVLGATCDAVSQFDEARGWIPRGDESRGASSKESFEPISLSLPDMKAVFDSRSAKIIDARDREEFDSGHIPGAVNLPATAAVTDPALLETFHSDGRALAVYCNGPPCESARNLAFGLIATGHRRVFVFDAGFPKWKAAGYPVESIRARTQAGAALPLTIWAATVSSLAAAGYRLGPRKARLIRQSWLIGACAMVVGVHFVLAALSKIADPATFAVSVRNFQLVPRWSESVIAAALPWVELIAALAILTGVGRRAGAAVLAGLLAVFTAGIVLAMARGLDFECGCVGTLAHTRVGMTKLSMNSLEFLAALTAALRRR